MDWGSVYSGVRGTLEIAYYLSGIALVIVATKGLAQIRVAKEIAQLSAKREAYTLAHEQCKMFAERLVPLSCETLNNLRNAKVELIDKRFSFEVKDGAFESHDFVLADVEKALRSYDPTDLLNLLEGYAMFFVSGVADEELGYRETAPAFCMIAVRYMPYFWWNRVRKTAQFRSVIELYEMWHERMKLDELTQQKEKIEDRMKKVKDRRVKALGTGA